MHLLAIDTSTNYGGVALAQNAEVIGLSMLGRPQRYQETLLDQIDFLLCRLDLALEDMDGFVVTCGPGSFTGVRIGMATVKGLAQVLQRPVVSISTLEAMAFRFQICDCLIAPMIDARRGQIYGAVFEARGDEMVVQQAEQVAFPEDWISDLPHGVLGVVGDGAELYRGLLERQGSGIRILEGHNFVLPELCRLGNRRLSRGEVMEARDLRANYLKPPDIRPAKPV